MKFRHAIQGLVTLFCTGMMLYCMVSYQELYPFAPYTMYSYRDDLKQTYYLRLYCSLPSGNKQLISDVMMRPFDEARIYMSLKEEYFQFELDETVKPKIIAKLDHLKLAVHANNYPCDTVQMKVVVYSDPAEFFQDKGTELSFFESGERP